MAKALAVKTLVSDAVTMTTTSGAVSVSVSSAGIVGAGAFEQGGGDFFVDGGNSIIIGGLDSTTTQLIGAQVIVVASGTGAGLELRSEAGADVQLRALGGSVSIRAEGSGNTLEAVAGGGATAQLSATSGSVTVQSTGAGHTVEILGSGEAGVHVATNAVIPANSAPIVVENIGYSMSVNVGNGGNIALSNPGGNILNSASQVANNVSNFGVQAANSIEFQGSSAGAQILFDLPSHSSSILLSNTGEIVITNPVPTGATGDPNFVAVGLRLFETDPDISGGFPAPVNSFGVQTTDNTLWRKFGTGDTDWSEIAGGGGGGGQLFDTVLTPGTFSFPNNDVPLALGEVTLVKYTTDFGGTTSRAFRGLVNTNGGNQIGQIVCFLNENGTPLVPVNGALVFQNEDLGSTDVNRFRTTGGAQISGGAQGAVWFIYENQTPDDPTNARWQQITNTQGS